MPVYELGYTGYDGLDPIVAFFDRMANFFFSRVFIERMPFFFLMLLLIALGQALFERRFRILHYIGMIFLICLMWPITSMLIWAFQSTEGAWNTNYILIGDLVIAIFLYVFVGFSIVKIKTKRLFTRYFWPYIVCWITLIVQVCLYLLLYQIDYQIITLLISIATMICLWVLLKLPPIRSRSLTM